MNIGNGSIDAQSVQTSIIARPAFQHLAGLLPLMDLRKECPPGSARRFAEPKQDAALCEIAKSLFRSQQRHALLTGAPGVGRTTTLMRFADCVIRNQFPFLSHHQLVYLDLRNVGEDDSRSCLETVVCGLEPGGATILFLDDVVSLLRMHLGRSNKPLLRALLQRADISAIGTLSPWDYAEYVGNDPSMLKTFSRVTLDEPDDGPLREIVSQVSQDLSRQFRIEIPSEVGECAIALSSTYLLSEYQPGKAIETIRRACEDKNFEFMMSSCDNVPLDRGDLVKVISDRTGIPEATIAGQARRFDYHHALRDAVVGQDEAIRQTATELELIAGGLSEPNKPASVMMFAGTTGVGKSELAKRIAELYSNSGRLQVYPMGNYTEGHSVSGIVGVPPGYVGHEQGGRLVNDLLADPYSVFLLDEAEKCHPNIWKPFLNLFDEGWIEDQRGRRAYGDRAIFILTTNAGDRGISQLSKSGKPSDEIAEQVRKTLSRVRQERSSQPVFPPPKFLSRIRKIIVFNALSTDAMVGIAERVVRKVVHRWEANRRKRLVIADDLVRSIGEHADRTNGQLGGEEGGRIITKLVREVVEHSILTEALANPEAYSSCTSIVVHRVGERDDPLMTHVTFEGVSALQNQV